MDVISTKLAKIQAKLLESGSMSCLISDITVSVLLKKHKHVLVVAFNDTLVLRYDKQSDLFDVRHRPYLQKFLREANKHCDKYRFSAEDPLQEAYMYMRYLHPIVRGEYPKTSMVIRLKKVAELDDAYDQFVC
jgi:TFIIF-interacting CTD phosphatase-like protein